MSRVVVVLMLILGVGSSAEPQPIKSVDFANLSYPWPKRYLNPADPQKTFTLVKGKIPLEKNSEGAPSNIGVTMGEVIEVL